jgi:hypothetical protein
MISNTSGSLFWRFEDSSYQLISIAAHTSAIVKIILSAVHRVLEIERRLEVLELDISG